MKKLVFNKVFPMREDLKRLLRIMKFTWLIILFACMQLSAKVYSQRSTFNIVFENAKLHDLMLHVKQNSEFDFIYSEDEIENVRINDAEFFESQVEEILHECLTGTKIDYKVEEKVIILLPAPPKPVVKKKQEKKELHGVVKDKDGIPLPGVSVVIKGSTDGTCTDIDGHYVLKFCDNPESILYSFVGMTTKEVKYTGQKILNVTLQADEEALNEVVVTGYSAIKKERATGSFVNIREDKLEEVHHDNLTEKLQTVAPGLLLTRKIGDNGEDDYSIQMRGQATLKGSAEPLVVIDGFPTATKVKDINPDDIKSINILQDAAAASIWGASAANGVIVIQTKKGRKSEKPNVSVSYNLTIETKPNLDRLQLASPEDRANFHTFIWDNNLDYNVKSYKLYDSPVNIGPAYKILENRDNDASYSDANAHTDLLQLMRDNQLKEYDDLFLQTGVTHDANVSINGGTDIITYYISASHRDKKFTSVRDKQTRDMLTINTDFKLNDKFKLSVGYSYNNTQSDKNGVGYSGIMGFAAGSNSIFDNYLNPDGSYARNYRIGGKTVEQIQEWDAEGHLPDYQNAYQDLKESDNTNETEISRYNLSLKYDLTSDLAVSARGFYEINRFSSRKYTAPGTRKAFYNLNRYTPAGTTKSLLEEGSEMEKYISNSTNKSFRTQLDYNKEYKDHKINALLGFEMREYDGEANNFYHLDYNDDTGIYRTNHYATVDQPIRNYKDYSISYSSGDFTTFNQSRFVSYYTNLAYTFKNRYTLTSSVRIDDGSMFGVDANKRRTPLWSVGASWNASSEEWFNSEKINMLKFRLTYGKNGIVNNAFSSFTSLRYRNTVGWKFSLPNASVANRVNPDLTWETAATTNFAVDMGMFDNRLTASLELYYKLSSDVLNEVITNPMTGASSMVMNSSEISNKGYTITVNGVVGKKFRWLPTLSISYNKNKVEKAMGLPSDASNFISETRWYGAPVKGHSVSEVFGFKYAGLSEDGDVMIFDENGQKKDPTQEKVSSLDAVHSFGDLSPKYWGALSNGFSYGNFTLNSTILFKFGHIFEGPTFYSNQDILHESIADMWMKPGDEASKTIPRFFDDWNRTRSDYLKNDLNWYKADHIRLQDISLSYNIPEQFTKKLGVHSARVRFQVANLGIIWAANDLDLDPERVPFSQGNSVTQMTNEAPVTYRPNIGQEPVYNFHLKFNF